MPVVERLEKSAEGVLVVDYDFARSVFAPELAERQHLHDLADADTVEGYHFRRESCVNME